MAQGHFITLEGAKALVVEFIGGRGGGPVKQSLICDHVTQEGNGPLPMQALEELAHAGILEHPEGPATPQSNGEPVILYQEWVFTQHGRRVYEQHKEKLAREKPKDRETRKVPEFPLPTDEDMDQASPGARREAAKRAETKKPKARR